MLQGKAMKFRCLINVDILKIIQAITSASDWLAAERTCISEGGTLAKIESAAENAAVLTLMGDTRDGETV